jgi:MOSC domain-containing protein YiiM
VAEPDGLFPQENEPVPAVANLFRAPKRRLPMEELHTVEAAAGLGFAGCAHARLGGNRQVLLVDKETLDAMELEPGILRENITTTGLNVNGLTVGERLRVGDALLQVSLRCTPCDQLENIRSGLRRELYGRRGMLCRVIEGGMIRSGDLIVRFGKAASA